MRTHKATTLYARHTDTLTQRTTVYPVAVKMTPTFIFLPHGGTAQKVRRFRSPKRGRPLARWLSVTVYRTERAARTGQSISMSEM